MLERSLSLVERTLVMGTYCALMLMMFLIAADATVRYLFKDTLPDIYTLTELYLMPAVVFFALANTQRLKAHVNVALFDYLLPTLLRRSLLSATYFAAAICFALITWKSFSPAWNDLAAWRVTAGIVQWPTGLSRAIVPLGTAVLTLRLIVDAFGVLQGKHDAAAATGNSQ